MDNLRQTILIVDDIPQNLLVLGELLQPLYNIRAANSGERALHAAASEPKPDLILLDIMMPNMDGYEVLTRLKQDKKTSDIPVIFVTALDSIENEEKGLTIGAVDYITKPINPGIVLARVDTHLQLKQARDLLAKENEWLDHEVNRRMRENQLIQDLSIRALACVAEVRDSETGRHIMRTQSYVEILAKYLANHPRFKQALSANKISMIVKAAPLHDIGKVGIPDAILQKPGPYTDEEFTIMKQHTKLGADAINDAMRQVLDFSDEETAELATSSFIFLHVAEEIARCHHEKWDGSGYPSGLSGEAIPVSARLMALADVFDALVNQRVYKPPLSISDATEIIRKGRGTHFDPDVVDAFIACIDQFTEIAKRFAEPLKT